MVSTIMVPCILPHITLILCNLQIRLARCTQAIHILYTHYTHTDPPPPAGAGAGAPGSPAQDLAHHANHITYSPAASSQQLANLK